MLNEFEQMIEAEVTAEQAVSKEEGQSAADLEGSAVTAHPPAEVETAPEADVALASDPSAETETAPEADVALEASEAEVVPEVDAATGTASAGIPDAGAADADTAATGSPDAGATDAGAADTGAADQPTPADMALTEAVLFASGDPITLVQLTQVTGLPDARQLAAIEALRARYEADSASGLCLREINQQYCLTTRPELREALKRLFEPRQAAKLSNAAYEALAVIAYNQPVTRAQIEAVRGVNSDNVIGRLIERGLVEIRGHLDAPGKPAQFGTTDRFLLEMGLSSVDELAPLEMMMYGALQDLEKDHDDQNDELIYKGE